MGLHKTTLKMDESNIDRKDKYLNIVAFLQTASSKTKAWAKSLEGAQQKKPPMRANLIANMLPGMKDQVNELKEKCDEVSIAQQVSFPKKARQAANEMMENIVYNSCIAAGAEAAFKEVKKMLEGLEADIEQKKKNAADNLAQIDECKEQHAKFLVDLAAQKELAEKEKKELASNKEKLAQIKDEQVKE